MMLTKRTAQFLAIGAAMTGVTSYAGAEMIVGEPVVAPYDQAQASIEFLGSEAAYTGRLSFLGSGDMLTVTNPAANDGTDNLGTLLFNNHEAALGASTVLPQLFSSGEVLHFAYEVVEPSHGQDLFRTDQAEDTVQFSFDSQSDLFGVEDLRLPNSDEDYNDAAFRVSFSQVPGPGALALFAVAVVWPRRRRRRTPAVTV